MTKVLTQPAISLISDLKSLIEQARQFVSTLSTHLSQTKWADPNCCDAVATIVVTASQQSISLNRNNLPTLSANLNFA